MSWNKVPAGFSHSRGDRKSWRWCTCYIECRALKGPFRIRHTSQYFARFDVKWNYMRGCVTYRFAPILVSVIIGDTLRDFGIFKKISRRSSRVSVLAKISLKPRISALTLPVSPCLRRRSPGFWSSELRCAPLKPVKIGIPLIHCRAQCSATVTSVSGTCSVLGKACPERGCSYFPAARILRNLFLHTY